MFVTTINDCNDQNAFARQATRTSVLLGNVPVNTLGVAWSDLEASGNLIDILDASEGAEGVIMVNVAPRHGKGKKWPNGTPFGYFYYKKTLVISTIDGYALSLAKKLNLTDTITLTDVPTVIDHMIQKGKLDKNIRDTIVKSQFRSFDYMPRLAQWIVEGEKFSTEEYKISEVADVPHTIWWVDSFGNCKTTMLPEDMEFEEGKVIRTQFADLVCYPRLKDVPDNEFAFIIGSSGIGDRRFIEMVIQGKSIADRFHLKSGCQIF